MMLSRVADSFYWMGRYTERAEHACRLLQITLTAGLEAGAQEADITAERAMRALGAAPIAARMGAIEEARHLTFGRDADVSSIYTAIFAARENARQVRDLCRRRIPLLRGCDQRPARVQGHCIWHNEPRRGFSLLVNWSLTRARAIVSAIAGLAF
jgi:A predicted alpha-helical domain with a conserved ER motif.